MNTANVVVGIDVSKKTLDIAMLVSGKIKTKALDNTTHGHKSLLEWLLGKSSVPMAQVHVCMEATGVYSEPVALALHKAGLIVSVVNPACIKGFGASENIRNKNDAIDAGLIARYCAAMQPARWQPPSIEQRQLRAWTLRLQALKDIRQQEENRMEAHDFTDMEAVSENVKRHIAWLSAEIAKLEDDINDHIDRHPGLKHDAELLRSIPGVGIATAAKLLGQLGDIRRFCNAKAFAAFLGVTPRQRTSGTSVRGRTMISRTGNTSLRAALYMPSLVARRHNPIVWRFAERLSATGMAKKAIICAIMHKLAHLIYGVIHTDKPFDPHYLEKGLAIQDGI